MKKMKRMGIAKMSRGMSYCTIRDSSISNIGKKSKRYWRTREKKNI